MEFLDLIPQILIFLLQHFVGRIQVDQVLLLVLDSSIHVDFPLL